MANEKDDVLKANQGAPAADIPNLKKKEKERKKGGAAWSNSGGGAGSFTGATGGTVARAAASAAVGAAEVGEVGGAGGIFSTISEFLAGLMSTLAGQIAVGAAALLMLAGAGALAYSLFHGGGTQGAVGGPNFGAISDSMKIHSGDGDMIGVNGKGELAFGGSKAAAAAAPTAPAAANDKTPKDQKAATDAKDQAKDAAAWTPRNVLAHNLSGAQLSTSLGGDFGSKNIFSGGNSYAPQFNSGLSQLSGKPALKGNLSSLAAKSTRGRVNGMDITRARSNQAIAQLKMARGMSALGANSPNAEGASAAADGAFDQQDPGGGQLNTIGAPAGISDGSTGGASTSGGAPDTTSMPGVSAPSGSTVDPGIQNSMNQIQQMAQEAAQLQKEGMEMIVAGAALIVVGIALMAIWGMEGVGAALIGIGGMLVGMGVMMEQMASMMGSMANQLGSAVASQVGSYQGTIVNQCTQQALTGDTSPCNSSESATATQESDAADSSALQQQSTVGTAAPTLGGPGGVTTNGGAAAGSGGASN